MNRPGGRVSGELGETKTGRGGYNILMKLDEGGQVYGAEVLLKHTGALETEAEGVRQGDADIEYIHRMRVASRRLRAALPLFGDCLPRRKSAAWLGEVRAITAALGEARDADVQVEYLGDYLGGVSDPKLRAGLERLLLRLRQKRAGLQPGLNKALDHLRKAGTLGAMRAALEPLAARREQVYIHTPALYRHAFESLRPRLEAFLGYDAIVADPARVTELHEMRIAAKWLRYTVEAFAPLYSGELKKWLNAVRDAQDALGTIHDCDVWTELIPAYLDEERERTRVFYGHTRPFPRLAPGVLAYAQVRQAEREALHARFSQDWQGWKAKDLWAGLTRMLQVPLYAPEQIYPPLAELLPDGGVGGEVGS